MPGEKPPSPELESTVERLAALVHDAWVEHRREAGWQYGDQRDEAARLSPLLVPYERLSDEDRETDRVTVRRTLAGLKELGYRLQIDDLESLPPGAREQLLAHADQLIARGQPLPAYDLTKRWLARHPADYEFELRNARALRRCGALQRALRVLEGLGDAADRDGERRGLIAAVHKELFVRARQRTAPAALEHLELAQRLYQEVFDESAGGHYWHGINAATLAVLQGRDELAIALAGRVRAVCDAAGESADHWLTATRAEAALVLRDFARAAASYRAAVRLAGERIGDIASMRHNALLLLESRVAGGADRRAVEDALRPPSVVIFAGCGVDSTGMPADEAANLERDVRAAIDERIQAVNAGVGVSGAAPGSEILFVEAMLGRKPGVMNVVLPWPREQYSATHVRPAGEAWQRRFAVLLGEGADNGRVQHVVQASPGRGADEPSFERFAQQLSFGIARLQARTLGSEAVPLVVRRGAKAARGDGLDELLDHWRSQGVAVGDDNVIDIEPLLERRRARRGPTPGRAAAADPGADGPESHVMAILFADVEDYSQIPEASLPAFIEYFVGGIGSRMSVRPYKPDHVRRVGDGLLMVFATAHDAASCALDLVEWANAHSRPHADGATFWSQVGLPSEMRIRVALHAGPLFECVDPLTHSPAFEGSHINYAARIEPVTPGNQVYASEAFAALTASWPASSDEFVCEYVGRTTLAKKAGEHPLYHVRRR